MIPDLSLDEIGEITIHGGIQTPHHHSFADFLENDARVPSGRGQYAPYSFAGREALLAIVNVIDKILGSEGGAPLAAVALATEAQRPDAHVLHSPAENQAYPKASSLSPQRGEGLRVRGENYISASDTPCSVLPDAELALAGGAQFGKTILELNLAAYCTGQLFRNFGLYLPDDDLVEGIVDSKFRPDVVDQIGWFAEMARVGKALNKSGKTVNRKGAFLVTDGRRKAVGMIRGLGKVPTTFSMDMAMMDEVDDIEPRMMKFVRGRLTASDLRFIMKIGTQRIHGRGMNKAWKDGSQGVFMFQCPNCGHEQNLEEEFPAIIRLRTDGGASVPASRLGAPAGGSLPPSQPPSSSIPNLGPVGVVPSSTGCASSFQSPLPLGGEGQGEGAIPHLSLSPQLPSSPQLTWSGDFKLPGSDAIAATHEPGNQYYLGCIKCGAELDRTRPIERHRQPERIKQRHWSYRISQLAIGAIDLEQIVARFQLAVADPQEMIVFRCDVLGLPQSTSQVLTPAIIERARSIESFDLAPGVREGCIGVAGLDMGDRCWLWVRQIGRANQIDFPQQSSPTAIASSPGAVPSTAGAGEGGRRPVEGNGEKLIKAPDKGQAICRLLAAEKMSAGDVVGRTIVLFKRMGLSALFIDERPLVNESRTIALALNGLQDLTQWPKVPEAGDAYVTLPGGLTWDGKNSRWLNLKCAVVRFTKNKLGAGIRQSIVFFEEGGQTKFVPCIECNRFETIDRVVREFLTPTEGVVEVLSEGRALRDPNQDSSPAIRQIPMMLLPRMTPEHSPILDTVEAHLITGSEREKAADGSQGDYVDACENHFLLADGYSKLAEIICAGSRPVRFAYEKVDLKSGAESKRRRGEV